MLGKLMHFAKRISFLLSRRISAIKSPQILELSGIGRADILSKIGVKLKVELPGVGENVQVFVEGGTLTMSCIADELCHQHLGAYHVQYPHGT